MFTMVFFYLEKIEERNDENKGLSEDEGQD